MNNNKEKEKALIIISKGVKIYDKFLNNKNLLIIYGAPNKPSFIITKSNRSNYLHLTGVILNKKYCPSAKEFYNRALNNELKVSDFKIKDNNTINKLQIISETLKIPQNATMLGDYSNNKLNLYSDKFVGNVKSCLGFTVVGKYCVPNTILKEDIRKVIITKNKVLAVLIKDIADIEFSEVIKLDKNIDLQELLASFSLLYPQVKFSNDLFDNNELIIEPDNGRK